jgi:DNA-binding HxlR family transcriptional regulator
MEQPRRSPCPISTFLDLWGDRWTLIVMRDLLCGKTRFSSFEASPERIPPSILAKRLARLTKAGYVERRPYSEHPPRHEYRPTGKGRSLRKVLIAMGEWSEAELEGTWRMPERFRT